MGFACLLLRPIPEAWKMTRSCHRCVDTAIEWCVEKGGGGWVGGWVGGEGGGNVQDIHVA